MTAIESPWFPVAGDIPWTVALVNPHGDRHLTFDSDNGVWHRLWQGRQPEPLHAGEAVFLRPSDVDQIIKFTNIWIMNHPNHSRAGALTDEIAQGVKALVLHFADRAGHN